MSDLAFLFDVAGSILVLTVPIALILGLVAVGGAAITDLFMMPGRSDLGPGPRDPETLPRWRPECLTPRSDRARNRPS